MERFLANHVLIDIYQLTNHVLIDIYQLTNHVLIEIYQLTNHVLIEIYQLTFNQSDDNFLIYIFTSMNSSTHEKFIFILNNKQHVPVH